MKKLSKRTKFVLVILIILTVAFLYIFYQAKYGQAFDKVMAGSTKSELRFLVGQIESFKVQNGQYPENLDQLFRFYKIRPRVDILLSRNHAVKDSYYNYHRTGSSFILYSSGIDQIPNNEDDIYPKIINPDSVNLIK